MKLSEKKKSALYDAIRDPIIDLRVLNDHRPIDIDAELFLLEQKIWRKVHKALNLSGPA